jgi:3-ketosteroid 9alpha-monooxygenase subunit A
MEEQGWVRWRLDPLGTLPIHPQEILDNMADYAHFVPGPWQPATSSISKTSSATHVIIQRFGAGHRTLGRRRPTC